MNTNLLLTNILQIVDYFYAFPDRDVIKLNDGLYTKDSFVETIRPLLPIELQNVTNNQTLIEALYNDFTALQTLQETAKNNIRETTSAEGINEQLSKQEASTQEARETSSHPPQTTHRRIQHQEIQTNTQQEAKPQQTTELGKDLTIEKTEQPPEAQPERIAEKPPINEPPLPPDSQIPIQDLKTQINQELIQPLNTQESPLVDIHETSHNTPSNEIPTPFPDNQPIHIETPPVIKNIATEAKVATQGLTRNVLGQIGTFTGNLGWTGLRLGSMFGNASSKVLTNVSSKPISGAKKSAFAAHPFANKAHLIIFGLILSFIGISFFSIFFAGNKQQTLTPETSETSDETTTGQTISKGFVGVNIPSLVTQNEAKINHMLEYLSNSCGVTVIRVFYANDDVENGLDQLKSLVKKAETSNVKLIITLANYGSDRTSERGNNLIDVILGDSPTNWYLDGYKGRYLKHVESVVTALKDSSAIYGWELANEPHCQGDAGCSGNYANWVNAMSAAIRAWDPNSQHLISIGTQANDDINLGDSISNGEYEQNNSSLFITALTGHYYNGSPESRPFNEDEFQKQKQKMLEALDVAKKLNKPFYIGEAGFLPNSDRADLLKKEMADFFSKGATGYLVWQYSDRANDSIDIDAFTVFEGDPVCKALKEQSEKLMVPIPQGGASDIAACTFYRGGDQIDGLKIANPLLSNLITEISSKVKIPAAIIASIMRVETQSAIISTSDYITNDYDAHCSLPNGNTQTLENCINSGIAFGVMQFTPNTFKETFNRNKEALKNLFGKTEATTDLTTQDSMAPTNVLRIYSIKDSITAAAFKVSADKQVINGDGPWDENTIKEIAKYYYGTNLDGTTNYPGWDGSTQNYGDDLWKSYSGCFSTSKTSCPIPDGKITCASYGKEGSWGGFTDICRVDNQGNGGHCSNNYLEYLQQHNIAGVCVAQNQSTLPIEAYAIDVASPVTGTEQAVYLPIVNGKKLKWYFQNQTVSASAGYIRRFESEPTPEGVWVIQFSHVVSDFPTFTTGQEVPSDFPGGYLFNQGANTHLHVTMGVKKPDGTVEWKHADRDLQMCVN